MDRTGLGASAASREVGALLRQRGGQMLPAPWPHAQALSSVMRWVAAVDEVVIERRIRLQNSTFSVIMAVRSSAFDDERCANARGLTPLRDSQASVES